MDTTDPEIQFDESGLCNHCISNKERYASRVFKGIEGKAKLDSIVKSIKASGNGNEYDCVIGVSGGVDSTYVVYIIKELGLRPLAIHFDNGWNSELAVSNIEKALNILGIDLFTYVIDWEEFKDLQISFLKASTPDGEIPTDHAITALLFREAAKRNIKFIIHGGNFASEASSVPAWAYGHMDWKYINGIHRRFGIGRNLLNYPHMSLIKLAYFMVVKRIKFVSILNYIDYDKNAAIEVLKEKLGWVYYGGKHYESVYTRFYQGYILPRKFNIDKRKVHLSDLINSGAITRPQAIEELRKDTLPQNIANDDLEFLLKKFEFTPEEFTQIMNMPIKKFPDYPNHYLLVKRLKIIFNFLRKLNIVSK